MTRAVKKSIPTMAPRYALMNFVVRAGAGVEYRHRDTCTYQGCQCRRADTLTLKAIVHVPRATSLKQRQHQMGAEQEEDEPCVHDVLRANLRWHRGPLAHKNADRGAVTHIQRTLA
jgi:hypothetical protein